MKTAIITQARMSSTRLPKKVMMPIKGVPLLQYHIQRAKMSNYPLIVATTNSTEDQIIVDFCKRHMINFFQGSLDNVLSRYYYAAKSNNLDVIVRISSDCPLIEPILIKQAVDLFFQSRADYVSNTLTRSYPRGFDVEVFSFGALEKAYQEAPSLEAKEHVTPVIWRNDRRQFKIKQLIYKIDKSRYRITVDTIEDFKLIKILIKKYNAHKLNYEQIITLLDQHPELVSINEKVKHKKDGQYVKN